MNDEHALQIAIWTGFMICMQSDPAMQPVMSSLLAKVCKRGQSGTLADLGVPLSQVHLQGACQLNAPSSGVDQDCLLVMCTTCTHLVLQVKLEECMRQSATCGPTTL